MKVNNNFFIYSKYVGILYYINLYFIYNIVYFLQKIFFFIIFGIFVLIRIISIYINSIIYLTICKNNIFLYNSKIFAVYRYINIYREPSWSRVKLYIQFNLLLVVDCFIASVVSCLLQQSPYKLTENTCKHCQWIDKKFRFIASEKFVYYR